MSFSRRVRFLDCAAVRSRVDAFILEDLPESESQRMEHHLRHCADCAKFIASEHEMLALIPRSLEPIEAPPDVLANLLERVRGGEGAERPMRRKRLGAGLLALAASVVLAFLVVRPMDATSWAERALQSPDVAVINLFTSLDSPLNARYEYRTETQVRFDRSVGRLLFNVNSGDWQLVVHGLPRPPHGGRYVLVGLVDGRQLDLGTIERWEDGVATLSGQSEIDLTATERLSLELRDRGSQLRLMDAVAGAW